MVAVSRRSFLSGLGAVSVVLGVPGAAVAHGRHAGVRFGCFNIHHGASPDDVMDLERVAVRIEAMGCDVIGLQEVDRFWKRSDYLDEPAWLAERLGMHVAFGANLDLDPEEPGKPRREYGTAMLSRWEITEQENTLLPNVGDHEQRGLLRTVVAQPDGPLTFATTHLTHESEDERITQAKKVVEILGGEPRATVLVGDFNAQPGDESIAVVTGAFTDSWAVVGDGDGFTYPSTGPESRIDYVFVSPDITPSAIMVETADPEASDHLPVHGEFTM